MNSFRIKKYDFLFSGKTIWSLLLCSCFFSACSPYFNQKLSPQKAIISPETPVGKELQFMPVPSERTVVAVYKFRDQSGQYKPSEVGASWSNAVTQGSTTILLRALENSGWFVPIERENIGNLLNERKIIKNSRMQHTPAGQKPQPLPPLLYAGVILEGGIISYEANVMTGGVGLKYFGAGGAAQYREDRVTVYLRAISTQSGEILKTVRTTKSILSQKIDGGLFRFIKYKRLLEFETGFTYNEPSEMAVTEAIEKAVQSMIIEGVSSGLWALKNPADIKSKAFQDYYYEKEKMSNTDLLNRPIFSENGLPYRFSVQGGLNRYEGDLFSPELSSSFSFEAGLRTYEFFELNGGLGYDKFKTANLLDASYLTYHIGCRYYMLPKEDFSPFVGLGTVAFIKLQHSSQENASSIALSGRINVGAEYKISENWGVELSLGYNYFNKDDIDGIKNGSYNDTFMESRIGLNYHFGRKKQ
ncbi:MAG: CsgG/HfaB family protein [Bacteroidales bacterium]